MAAREIRCQFTAGSFSSAAATDAWRSASSQARSVIAPDR
jgi:hypothetical protein